MRITLFPCFTLPAACLLVAAADLSAQGNLAPPGAPGPTMRTLIQIEPRTPISSLPYALTNSGSYYLTANLTGVAGQHGITVNAGDVAIDLNGFSLIGGGGNSKGILVGGSSIVTNVWIGNGTIRNWDGGGVDAPYYHTQLENIRLTRNGGLGGARLGTASQVSRCSALGNTAPAISVGAGSTVTDCKAELNAANGIVAGPASMVLNSVAYFNGGTGILAGDNGTVMNCVANQNSTNGIVVGSGALASSCVAYFNNGAGLVAGDYGIIKDCTSQFNQGGGVSCGSLTVVSGCNAVRNADGIVIQGNCRIVDNLASYNLGAGIRNSTNSGRSRIDGNTVIGNFGSGLTIFNSLIVRNTVIGSNTNYLGTGNDTGPTASGASTSTSPWANF